MSAPIYSQVEADALIRMAKRAEFEAWEREPETRPTTFEASKVIRVTPEEDNDGRIEFKIDLRRNEEIEKFSITLIARIHPRTFEGMCRYDVHPNPHDNPEWFAPPSIFHGDLHAHRYSERSVRELDCWDGCALSLGAPRRMSFPNRIGTLKQQFLTDLRVRFSDSDTINRLFEI